jgi:hypothetical protein
MICGSGPTRCNRFFSQKHEDQLRILNVYQRFFPHSHMNLGMKLAVHLHVVPQLGTSGAIPPLPIYAIIVWTAKLPLPFTYMFTSRYTPYWHVI